MRTDSIECWNKDCEHRDGLFEFSCRALVGLAHDGEYVERCQKFMRRTPEHAAVVRALKQLSDDLKTARKKKISPKYPLLKASWIGRRYAIKETIKLLAHNWINRNKKE